MNFYLYANDVLLSIYVIIVVFELSHVRSVHSLSLAKATKCRHTHSSPPDNKIIIIAGVGEAEAEAEAEEE